MSDQFPIPVPAIEPGLQAAAARVAAGLEREHGVPVDIRGMRRLPGGACQENFAVDLVAASLGSATQRYVLRSDAASSLPGSLRRAAEYQVATAAHAAGVKTPPARWLCHGLLREGADAYFLDWIDGEAIGRRVVKSPSLADARQKLAEELAAELARIHAVTPLTAASIFVDGPPGVDPAVQGLAFSRQMVDALKEPHPGLEIALVWLAENLPRPEAPVLVHGDFRTGNFMVAPAGLSGVLDWEFAHWGSRWEDAGWISVRDWRFGQLGLPIGGFAPRADFYAAYEKASGREVDRQAVHWWEIFGNVRWAAGSMYQGERYLSGEERDIELVAIARRACEMEFEALRLIEAGF